MKNQAIDWKKYLQMHIQQRPEHVNNTYNSIVKTNSIKIGKRVEQTFL